jgi:predicted RNA-binding Zn ribbon-like protein
MDPRPLTGEPLPLDLLNTYWIDDGVEHDLLADEAGMRLWLDLHELDAPVDPRARRALVRTREALRTYAGGGAFEPVNDVLARGARRPLLSAEGVSFEIDSAPAWRVPWLCAASLVELLEARAHRVRKCANPDCVLWFLDVSRAGQRRWCSMSACGNREKALRHGRLRRR